MGNTLSILTDKTFVGWAVISAGIAYAVYKQYGNKKTQRKITAQKQKGHELRDNHPKKENKAKRQRLESFASEPKQAQPKSYAATAQSKAKGHSSDDGLDNREFAKQMAQNKQNKFTPKVSNEQKQKSVKQSKAKEINLEAKPGKVSVPSSTAGVDADDDQSSAASPAVSAADPVGVSDMLEQQAQGPSVLRLTDTAEKQKKPKAAKSPQRVETKKQRQNRLKAERAKADREEEEKARKALMEVQRRKAREAEGRAAKDGSGFVAAQKSSAWTGAGVNGKAESKAAPAAFQPLDTFDNEAEKATSVAPAKGKENSKQNGNGPGWADIPYSEEEQLEMLKKQAEEDEWVPVSTKSRKTKSKNANVVSETDDSAGEASAPATDKSALKAETNGRPKAKATPSQSSFANLADEGADLGGDEQQEPQEWDV